MKKSLGIAKSITMVPGSSTYEKYLNYVPEIKNRQNGPFQNHVLCVHYSDVAPGDDLITYTLLGTFIIIM